MYPPTIVQRTTRSVSTALDITMDSTSGIREDDVWLTSSCERDMTGQQGDNECMNKVDYQGRKTDRQGSSFRLPCIQGCKQEEIQKTPNRQS
mmetsp:Transcript_1945/g.2602  ORF Transcript_1945/g.2602 Transcript_1945/m.2602 type:complete len:92 (-) Transcript_1945:41-316(-)